MAHGASLDHAPERRIDMVRGAIIGFIVAIIIVIFLLAQCADAVL